VRHSARRRERPTRRVYTDFRTGEKIPENQTLDASTAGADLDVMRTIEAASERPDYNRLQPVVDSLREAFPNKELPADFIPQRPDQSNTHGNPSHRRS
jgi:hypothetical protein